MNPRANTPRRKGAFTLIELLVVIAIIALLVSILVPSLSAARKLTQKAICQTHLKNMGIGMNMYIQENVDWLMPYYQHRWYKNDPTTNLKYTWLWQEAIVQYCDSSAIPTDGRAGTANWAYVGNQNFYPDMTKNYKAYGAVYSRVMNCPTQTNSGRLLHYGMGRNYELEYTQAPLIVRASPYYNKIDVVKNVSSFIVLYESTVAPLNYQYSNGLVTNMAAGTVHIGYTSNFLLASGGVITMTDKDIALTVPIANRNPFAMFP